jgi:Spy/CpxP family protein refolding chaperone
MPASFRKWMWLTLLLTLILGMCLGILLDALVLGRDEGGDRRNQSRGDRTERYKAKLENELGLTPDQMNELDRVLTSNREKADAFWKQSRESYNELRKEFRQAIRALLTPEQQEKYDEMVRKHDERRKKDKGNEEQEGR